MLQIVLVGLLLFWALFYIVRSLRKQLTSKKACASSCKCGVDFDEIEANLKSK